MSADERYLERYRRDDTEGWWYHEYCEDGTVKLSYLSLNLTLDDIYEGLLGDERTYSARDRTATPQ